MQFFCTTSCADPAHLLIFRNQCGPQKSLPTPGLGQAKVCPRWFWAGDDGAPQTGYCGFTLLLVFVCDHIIISSSFTVLCCNFSLYFSSFSVEPFKSWFLFYLFFKWGFVLQNWDYYHYRYLTTHSWGLAQCRNHDKGTENSTGPRTSHTLPTTSSTNSPYRNAIGPCAPKPAVIQTPSSLYPLTP